MFVCVGFIYLRKEKSVNVLDIEMVYHESFDMSWVTISRDSLSPLQAAHRPLGVTVESIWPSSRQVINVFFNFFLRLYP